MIVISNKITVIEQHIVWPIVDYNIIITCALFRGLELILSAIYRVVVAYKSGFAWM